MRILLLLSLSLPTLLFSQTASYPLQVEAVLKKSGTNRPELERAITYFKKSNDPLKLKAIYFLISNMDIHYSKDYYWADSATGKRIDYNELNYPDLATAVEAFDRIKATVGKVKPVPYKYYDIDSIKASILIDNIDRAFALWKLPPSKNLTFDEFCEYLLPYRVSTEPLQNWRKEYHEKFKWIADSNKGKRTEDALSYIAADFKTWFVNTWDTEVRKEPLPRLGPLQLLSRRKGNCDDIGDLQVYTLRSQGYPAVLEHIPYWATTSGRHYFNSTFDEDRKAIPFDISTPKVKINNFSREPSKVIRITYSKQNVLAAHVPEKFIPSGFMRTLNYKDVTSDYWKTADLSLHLFNSTGKPPVVFACVFNTMKWQPTWWGRVQTDSVVFTNMCKGAVFLPMYYSNDRLIPAGYPVAAGYNYTLVLKPDTINRRSVNIKQQDKYLILRPDKHYKLYFWDNNWKLLARQKALEGSTELVFENVPKNALMMLIPEYSQGKERPFTITDEGERLWW